MDTETHKFAVVQVQRACVFCFWSAWLLAFLWLIVNRQLSMWMPLCVPVSLLVADFLGGVGHWTLDTWGTTDTPLIGGLIADFREHHERPQRLLERTFSHRNGEASAVALLLLLSLCASPLSAARWPLTHCTLLLTIAWLALTNEVHRWSHIPKQKHVPIVVSQLQRYGVFISRQKHAQHHRDAHDRNYCILTGWCNAPLDTLGFWRRAEHAIVRWTPLEVQR